MHYLMRFLVKMLPAQKVYAHCDIPCGIYDPKPSQIAAATILKMVQLIQALPLSDTSDQQAMIAYHNLLTRYIWTKEEHGRKCKEELFILWADYFKKEHLEQFPDLHDIFWNAIKLCSKNKQEVSIEKAQELVKAVDEIADMFAQTKSAKK